MSALSLASVRLSKLTAVNSIPKTSFRWSFVQNLFYFHISSFSGSESRFVSYIGLLVLLVSQLQTQQMMMSQIRSHLEYLIHTYNILLIILYSKLMKNWQF